MSLATNVVSVDKHLAPVGKQCTSDDLDQGSLSSTIGAQEAEDLPRVHLKGNAPQGLDSTLASLVVLQDSSDRNHCRLGIVITSCQDMLHRRSSPPPYTGTDPRLVNIPQQKARGRGEDMSLPIASTGDYWAFSATRPFHRIPRSGTGNTHTHEGWSDLWDPWLSVLASPVSSQEAPFATANIGFPPLAQENVGVTVHAAKTAASCIRGVATRDHASAASRRASSAFSTMCCAGLRRNGKQCLRRKFGRSRKMKCLGQPPRQTGNIMHCKHSGSSQGAILNHLIYGPGAIPVPTFPILISLIS